MKSKYKPYPKYKDSGVEWLAEIPEHWIALPARSIVVNQMHKNDNAKDQRYLSLMANVGVIRYEDKGDIGNKKPDDLTKCKVVKKGNLVINSMNYSIGSYGMSDYDGVCSPVYIVLDMKIEKLYPLYGLRLFENKAYQRYIASFGNGILAHRSAISWDEIKGSYMPLPPLQEQKAIATYLDRATQKIDSLIEKQEQLIALLKEKRQALISHAVTKGLDPDAKMKDSGVEWLGEIPEGWEVWKISHAFNTIGSGTTPSSTKSSYYDGHIPWVTTGELRENTIFSTKKLLTDEAIKDNTSLRLFPIGSIVIAMYGATIGRLGVLGIKATTNQACCVITDSSSIKNQYLYYWLMGYRDEIIKLGYGGGQPNISQDTISSLKISAPNIEEQNRIVTYLDQKTQKIDTLITKATQAITILKEKRTALISAVVTGKVDVRGEVA